MSTPIATAEVNVVAEEVTTIVEREKITLTMDRKVAETLRCLCNEVVGSDVSTRRKHTNAVWDALVGAGVEFPKGVQFIYGRNFLKFQPEENL